MIAIIDYGLGNIKAFANVYKQLNIDAVVVTDPGQLYGADKIILPGVGSFDYAMQRLNNSGMREALDDLVLNKSVPVLGICVGMQMLAKSSEEGKLPGLGWIDGTVTKFDSTLIKFQTHLPHMGWNNVKPIKEQEILRGLGQDAKFYFLHSYYFSCCESNDSIAVSNYGIDFTCVLNHKNIFGVQFHPEKSHHHGIKLLKSFAEL